MRIHSITKPNKVVKRFAIQRLRLTTGQSRPALLSINNTSAITTSAIAVELHFRNFGYNAPLPKRPQSSSFVQ